MLRILLAERIRYAELLIKINKTLRTRNREMKYLGKLMKKEGSFEDLWHSKEMSNAKGAERER